MHLSFDNRTHVHPFSQTKRHLLPFSGQCRLCGLGGSNRCALALPLPSQHHRCGPSQPNQFRQPLTSSETLAHLPRLPKRSPSCSAITEWYKRFRLSRPRRIKQNFRPQRQSQGQENCNDKEKTRVEVGATAAITANKPEGGRGGGGNISRR